MTKIDQIHGPSDDINILKQDLHSITFKNQKFVIFVSYFCKKKILTGPSYLFF